MKVPSKSDQGGASKGSTPRPLKFMLLHDEPGRQDAYGQDGTQSPEEIDEADDLIAGGSVR